MARPGLNTHRKFRRLARALGSRIVARGVLELLWDSCYESGEDYVGTSEDIEAAIDWNGEAGLVTRALRDAGAPEGHGFIEPLEEASVSGAPRYRVHDLWHHAPDYVAKRRQRELERLSKMAPVARGRHSAPNGGQYPPTPDRPNGAPPPPSPSPSPSPSPQGKSGSPVPHAAAEPDFDLTQEASEPREQAVVLTFPTVGKGGGEWWLTDAQVQEWSALYPALDIEAQCRQALAWVKANLSRRKTPAGMEKFLVGWFNRTNDRGGAHQQSRKPGAKPQCHVPDDDDPRLRRNCKHDPMCPSNQWHQMMLDREREHGSLVDKAVAS